MFIQLLYGVYTNSLGLISDAIHMAFDNLAIAIGLFASIMATWKPDSVFTYGCVLVLFVGKSHSDIQVMVALKLLVASLTGYSSSWWVDT